MLAQLVLLSVLAASFVLPDPPGPAKIETGDLEVRLRRVYVPVGEELQVYRYAPMTLLDDGDTVLTTYIDHAWEGIAVSRPLGPLADSIDVSEMTALIEMAEVDEDAVMRIGTDLKDLELLTPDHPLDRVEIIKYDDPLVMEEDFQADLIDGMITFSDFPSPPEEIVTQAYPIPYIAVMIPNIGRDWNYQGQLTTSLYYRFDADHLALGFDGDRVRLTHRFRSRLAEGETDRYRLYDYNPERGRRLFEAMTIRPPELSISSNNPSLSGIVHFFADIISRDRCPISIVDDARSADLRIEFVPLRQSLPSVTIYSLYYHLLADSLPGTVAAEQVRLIKAELEYVEAPRAPDDYYRHLDLAGRIMMEELGVFPLFRPTLFLHAQKRLQGVTADRDGFLDFSHAALLKLPVKPEALE